MQRISPKYQTVLKLFLAIVLSVSNFSPINFDTITDSTQQFQIRSQYIESNLTESIFNDSFNLRYDQHSGFQKLFSIPYFLENSFNQVILWNKSYVNIVKPALIEGCFNNSIPRSPPLFS